MRAPEIESPVPPMAGGNRAQSNDRLGRRDPLLDIPAEPARQLSSLAAVHRALGFPPDEDIGWLLDEGVSPESLWPIAGAIVRFDGDVFDFDDGEPALIFRALDRNEVVDLVAWRPQSGALASWRGRAFCLGDLEQLFNPGTYFSGGALCVHAEPLAWLKAEREGIVIVKPALTWAYFRNAPRLSFADSIHAEKVKRWLRPPKAKTKFLVTVPMEAAAA